MIVANCMTALKILIMRYVFTFRYLQTFDLEEPSDDIRLVLTKLAITCKFYSKRKSIEDGEFFFFFLLSKVTVTPH